MTVLASAARVLGCFLEGCDELTVTELVRQFGMPKSNASRLLRSMRDAGLLETIGNSKRYRPSLMLVDVGRAYRRSSPLLNRADAVVQRISQACGHTGYVTKRDGLQVVAITDHQGTNALRVASSVGMRLPAFASATGRSLLARLTNEAVAALHGGVLPRVPSANSPQSMAKLFERLDVIRTSGFATSDDEAARGVAAVAVAVGDEETGEEVSLCISFPAATSDAAERLEIARALRFGAAELASFGHDNKFIPATGGVPGRAKGET